MSRLPCLQPDALTSDQRTLFDAITGGRRRTSAGVDGFLNAEGGLRGPFNAWLHTPDAGQQLQRLGEILRFEGQLPAAAREIAVLCVAAHWQADYEWSAHARIAGSSGVSDAVIETIRTRGKPALTDTAEQAAHDVARAVLEHGQVTDALYARAVDVLGRDALVELVILLGYYSLISMTLNVFQVPLPPGTTPPFEK
jgi:4-carboxymuconolactone decarboxylase